MVYAESGLISAYIFRKFAEKMGDIREIGRYADEIKNKRGLRLPGACASSFMELIDEELSHDGSLPLRMSPVMAGMWLMPYICRFRKSIKGDDQPEDGDIQKGIDEFYSKYRIGAIIEGRKNLMVSQKHLDSHWWNFEWGIVPDLYLACALSQISKEQAIEELNKL